MIDLNGKRALVTGGSRGIGAAIALSLADSGADVAFTFSSAGERARATATMRNSGDWNSARLQTSDRETRTLQQRSLSHLAGLPLRFWLG